MQGLPDRVVLSLVGLALRCMPIHCTYSSQRLHLPDGVSMHWVTRNRQGNNIRMVVLMSKTMTRKNTGWKMITGLKTHSSRVFSPYRKCMTSRHRKRFSIPRYRLCSTEDDVFVECVPVILSSGSWFSTNSFIRGVTILLHARGASYSV